MRGIHSDSTDRLTPQFIYPPLLIPFLTNGGQNEALILPYSPLLHPLRSACRWICAERICKKR